MSEAALFWTVYGALFVIWVAALAIQSYAEMRRQPPADQPGVQVIDVASDTLESEGYDGTD